MSFLMLDVRVSASLVGRVLAAVIVPIVGGVITSFVGTIWLTTSFGARVEGVGAGRTGAVKLIITRD